MLSKRKLRKVCRDLTGISRKEFNKAHKEIYADKSPANGIGKYGAIGLAGVSMLPSLALADNPPAQVEKQKEDKKPFLKIDGRADVDAIAGRPYAHIQGDFNFNFGEIARINNWLDGGLIGGNAGEEKVTKLYDEIKAYFFSGIPIQPVVGVDLEKGKPAVYRGGIATKMIDVIKGLKAGIEFYPLSNNNQDLLWIKTGLDLGKYGDLFFMTRRLYDRGDENDGENLKKIYRFRYSIDLVKGLELAVNYWIIPKKEDGVLMLGASYNF